MFAARLRLAERRGRMPTLEELGAEVARVERRDGSYAGSVVRRWLKGMSEPGSLATWRALAKVLGVAPGWLAFGEGAMEPGAQLPPPAEVLTEGPVSSGLRAHTKKPTKRRGTA